MGESGNKQKLKFFVEVKKNSSKKKKKNEDLDGVKRWKENGGSENIFSERF